ncbi:IS3 family transposase [Bacillus pseudomycoides]|uniref:IS3 family transposase n=1 Tax=Bacillus pseudomycoides TaxID=64104 RepID=UPI00211D4D49|nr:IS3 family transposase [Bacillus pseudomycoides]MED1537079.1 IS3 family transposase [Bacillus pseudomycoides]
MIISVCPSFIDFLHQNQSFFSHFKSEMFYLNYYQTKEELIQAIETYIYHYNYKRFQKRLNHRAPIEYRISMAA